MSVAIRKGYADTAAGQVHYRTAGAGDPPLVLLQQTASSSQMYVRMMERLGEDRTLIAPDTPGFGGSFDPASQPAMADYAGWVLEALDGLGVGAFHVFGHHTGGCIGVELAACHPHRVASLMLCGPMPLSADERLAFSAQFGDPIAPTADGAYLRETWEYLRGLGADRELDVHHREMVDTLRAWRGRAMAYSAVWEQDWTAAFEAAQCPMLLLCARDDVLFPFFERARAMRPDACAVVVEGANFEPDFDAVSIVAAVKKFLAGGSSQTAE